MMTSMDHSTILKFLSKPVAPVKSSPEKGILYWKEYFFYLFSVTGLYVTSIVYIFSFFYSVKTHVYAVAFMDTVIYSIALVCFTSRRLAFGIRIFIFLLLLYILSVGLILLTGSKGAGFIWLMAFAVMAGVFLPLRYNALMILLNFLTLTGIGYLIKHDLLSNGQFIYFDYEFIPWIIDSINFVGLNIILVITIAGILNGLEKQIAKERELNSELERDQKELKNMVAKAEESDKLKSAFLANMSHEIRTPMNAILGFSELMMNRSLPEEKKSMYVSIIRQKGELLLNLLNDIIDISKIQANQLTIRKEECNVNDMLDQLHYSSQQMIKMYFREDLDIVLVNQFGKENLRLMADSNRLEQVFTNLLNNAIKFSEGTAIKYGIDTITEREIVFFVSNTGEELTEEQQDYIFKRFRQVDSSIGSGTGGTGLGLAISRSLTELMGGRIWVTSKDRTNTFYFSVPRN
ncbi:MAG TPA: ATP-binding protein [Bacteroidales bacterium]|nr:ATP-binding protein [Bacteroidales bacterium]